MTTAPPKKIPREEVPEGRVLCEYCTGKCCRYFALPLEEPESREDFEFIRWYLLHGAATVFTEDETWYLMVHNVCDHLLEDNRCGIYETRPQICRDYTTKDCEYEDDWVYDRYFETPEQIGEYAEAVFNNPKKQDIRSPRPALLPIVG